MGQKTNPNIFQLSKTDNWNSNYIEKKSKDFYLQTSKDLEVKKFIIKFFKNYNLNVHNCKLNYSTNNLSILISYQQNFNSVYLLNEINKAQKIKLIKTNSFLQQLNYKKKYIRVFKNIKNYSNYENLIYKKNLLKKGLIENKIYKLKRLKLLQNYKKYLALKTNKNINNLTKKSFLNGLFESLAIFYNNLINITLILQPLNSNICNILNKKQQNLLKKKLIKLKKYQRNEFFKEGINLMFSAVNEKNSANLLSKFISFSLKKLKRHNFFLRFIKTALTMFMSYKTISSKIKGIKINVKGRLNRVPRAKSKMITIGNVPLLTIDSNIDYSETTSYTTNGSIGVKVWVCEKLKTKNVKWT